MATNGKTTTIDVATLPKKKRKQTTPRHFSDEDKARLVRKVAAAVEKGYQVQEACEDAGIADALYYGWRKNKKVMRTPANGNGSIGKGADTTVQVSLQIEGKPVIVSLEEARNLHTGLSLFFNKG